MPINVNTNEINKLGAKLFNSTEVIKSSLVVYLDANIGESYPGSGTVWYDLSGNGNNFNIVATAYKRTSSVAYMDFNGSYGCAKNGSDISLSDSTGITYILWTRVLNSSANWRTLTRAYSGDHHVIVQSGTENLGMYDNDAAGFLDSGYDVTSFPNYLTSKWICLYFRWQSSSPYYEVSYNDTPQTIRGSITNSNARYNRGFGSIGAYHNGTTTPSDASQYWGDIGMFMCYNKRLTNSELLQTYNATRNSFGY